MYVICGGGYMPASAGNMPTGPALVRGALVEERERKDLLGCLSPVIACHMRRRIHVCDMRRRIHVCLLPPLPLLLGRDDDPHV